MGAATQTHNRELELSAAIVAARIKSASSNSSDVHAAMADLSRILADASAAKFANAASEARLALTASSVELPGLTARVHSVPVGRSDARGDVHYVSVGPSRVVSRIALANLSGHGQAVALFGKKLRELMQRYLSQNGSVSVLRKQVEVTNRQVRIFPVL
jgi:hypothetical protein